MKSKFHLIKQQIHLQLTDGSIIKCRSFSKVALVKLNVDLKSHLLWKEFQQTTLTENFVTSFMKKYLPTK